VLTENIRIAPYGFCGLLVASLVCAPRAANAQQAVDPASATSARTQTTPPDTTSTLTRPNFSGTWVLDRSISSDPAQATFDTIGARAGGARSGRGGGFGGRGGGFGGAGGGNTTRNPGNATTPEERNRLRELTDQVKRSSAAIVISHIDPTFTVTDAQGHAQVFQTDGSIDQRQLATVFVDSSAHWDDSRLVIEYVVGVDRKLLYTYTLLPKTMQLVIRIRLDASQTQRSGTPEVKLVYDQKPTDK
jgi:hypothetical protein